MREKCKTERERERGIQLRARDAWPDILLSWSTNRQDQYSRTRKKEEKDGEEEVDGQKIKRSKSIQ